MTTESRRATLERLNKMLYDLVKVNVEKAALDSVAAPVAELELRKVGFTCERTGERHTYNSMTDFVMAFLTMKRERDEALAAPVEYEYRPYNPTTGSNGVSAEAIIPHTTAPVPQQEVVEREARIIAAKKMGLIKDPYGEKLPNDLWRQCIPEAKAALSTLPQQRVWTREELVDLIAPRTGYNMDNYNGTSFALRIGGEIADALIAKQAVIVRE